MVDKDFTPQVLEINLEYKYPQFKWALDLPLHGYHSLLMCFCVPVSLLKVSGYLSILYNSRMENVWMTCWVAGPYSLGGRSCKHKGGR